MYSITKAPGWMSSSATMPQPLSAMCTTLHDNPAIKAIKDHQQVLGLHVVSHAWGHHCTQHMIGGVYHLSSWEDSVILMYHKQTA